MPDLSNFSQFKGHAKRLESVDISRLAHTIRCGEDHLHAVMEVETRGGGFDKYGRIKMLFEPHVFYRELSGAQREAAVSAGLAYQRWGEQKYPRDSYDRLARAMAINADAALRSCSWGLGQIMGFNCVLAGYSTAQSMVEAFKNDEDTHLAAMVQFIISNGLDDELRREDWRGFARGYNGAGYAKHGYHTKLKAAFDKWQRIPDTPWTPAQIVREEQDPNPPEEFTLSTRGMFLQRGMKGPDVLNLQGIMAGLGYHVGKHDSDFGRLLHSAMVAFQSDMGLHPDGKVGDLTWSAIHKAQMENMARPLRMHSEDTLREAGSRTIATADKAELQTKVAAAGVGGLGLLDIGQDALARVSGSGDLLAQVQSVLLENWIVLLIIALGALAYFQGPKIAARIREIRVSDAVTLRNLGK